MRTPFSVRPLLNIHAIRVHHRQPETSFEVQAHTRGIPFRKHDFRHQFELCGLLALTCYRRQGDHETSYYSDPFQLSCHDGLLCSLFPNCGRRAGAMEGRLFIGEIDLIAEPPYTRRVTGVDDRTVDVLKTRTARLIAPDVGTRCLQEAAGRGTTDPNGGPHRYWAWYW